jgi:hypothetical protein
MLRHLILNKLNKKCIRWFYCTDVLRCTVNKTLSLYTVFEIKLSNFNAINLKKNDKKLCRLGFVVITPSKKRFKCKSFGAFATFLSPNTRSSSLNSLMTVAASSFIAVYKVTGL